MMQQSFFVQAYQNPPKWESVSEATFEPSFIAARMSPSFL